MSVLKALELGWYVSHPELVNQFYKDMKTHEISINENVFNIESVYKKCKANKKQKPIESKEHEDFIQEILDIKTKFEDLVSILKRQGLLLCRDEVAEIKAPVIDNSSSNEIDYRREQAEARHLESSSLDSEASKNVHSIEFNNAKEGKINSEDSNVEALKIAELIYSSTENIDFRGIQGSNFGPPTIQYIQNAKFVFPSESRFFCRDVFEIETHLQEKFDLILLDPPWWNKYIRRKRAKSSAAYNMMYNHDLKQIPLEKYLKDDGLVVVWCTNSKHHLDNLQNDILTKWGVKFTAKWYWVKVTKFGEPICLFSKPPSKQPFEQIIFGCSDRRKLPLPPSGKLIISIPSALHSHKPPLIELLKPYLPESPNCLELFARYLVPRWTSYGLEAIKLQHESLFNVSDKKKL